MNSVEPPYPHLSHPERITDRVVGFAEGGLTIFRWPHC